MRYVLSAASASPGGTESVIETSYKHTSLEALRKVEFVDRKKMTAVCAKNNLSYKRAMARFNPDERAAQLQRAREGARRRRGKQRQHTEAAACL